MRHMCFQPGFPGYRPFGDAAESGPNASLALREAARQTWDVVVLDPPKLIRSRAELDEGTRKHFDMNRLAMQLVRPGGIFLSCTCSGLLDWAPFLKLLHSAARQAGEPLAPVEGEEFARRSPRAMQILAKTGAAMDHPIGSSAPETEVSVR